MRDEKKSPVNCERLAGWEPKTGCHVDVNDNIRR